MDKKEQCLPYTMLGEKAYRTKHIAHNLSMNVETIRRAIRTGKLKAHKHGKQYFIIQSDLNDYLLGDDNE